MTVIYLLNSEIHYLYLKMHFLSLKHNIKKVRFIKKKKIQTLFSRLKPYSDCLKSKTIYTSSVLISLQ